MKRSAFLSIALSSCLAFPLTVQAEATLPEEFTGVPNLRAIEPLAGLEAHVSNVSEMVWMRDPETGFRIVGFVFDKDGKSVNPAHAAAASLTLEGFIAGNFPPDSVRIPEPLVPDVESRLVRLGEADRTAAIQALITTLRDVQGEEAFNQAVKDWLVVIDEKIGEAAPAEGTPEAEPAADAAEAAPEAAADAEPAQQ